MFDSVLGRGVAAPVRFGTGAVVSAFTHALLVAGALILSMQPAKESKPEIVINFPDFRPPRGGGAPAASPEPVRRRKIQPRTFPKSVLVQPSILPPPDPTPPPVDNHPPGPDAPSAIGVSGSGGPGPDLGGEGPGGDGGGGGGEVEVFTGEMTRPVQLEGRDPQYTREALEAHVEGVMVARCVITTAGRLEGCRILKPLPHMEQAVLASLATRRYTPVMYQGRPVSVQYVFQIRLVLPR
jgi:periplasmic protein TonB